MASSGPLEKINKALSITGLHDYFDGKIYSSYVVGSWKPDPGIFLHAAKDMGVQPNECAVVEDSPLGITAAKAAGMHSILYDPHNIHSEISSMHTIKHMRELSGVIT